MHLSIIIVTRNRAALLAQALASFRRVVIPQGIRPMVLVVDNGSTDETAEVIRGCQLLHLPVRYTHEPRRGQCLGRNRGLAETGGEFILFTDDDVRVPVNWLEAMCAPMAAGKASVVAGGVTLPPGLVRPWMGALHYAWLSSTLWLDPAKPQSMVGANMGFLRDVLQDVPAFDPELGPGALGFGDDTLFAAQLVAAGHSIAGRLDVCVEHHFSPSRLGRRAWLDVAVRAGKVSAYMTHHWQHKAYRLPRVRLLCAYGRLLAWRARFPLGYDQEGCSERELRLVMRAAELRAFLGESKRPRHYALQGLFRLSDPTLGAHGAAKLASPLPPEHSVK